MSQVRKREGRLCIKFETVADWDGKNMTDSGLTPAEFGYTPKRISLSSYSPSRPKSTKFSKVHCPVFNMMAKKHENPKQNLPVFL